MEEWEFVQMEQHLPAINYKGLCEALGLNQEGQTQPHSVYAA